MLTVGAMFLSGTIQNADEDEPSKLPIRVGLGIIPIMLVALAHAVQRVFRPRKFAFMIAGALVCALGSALRPDLEPLQRFLDALRGFVVGGIVMGFLMSVDDESDELLDGGAKPWRELFMGTLLVTFGAFPSGIYGGFVLALPAILLGIGFLARCIRYDAPIVVPRKNAGAAFRIFIALLFLLLACGFLVVCPMISLGLTRPHR